MIAEDEDLALVLRQALYGVPHFDRLRIDVDGVWLSGRTESLSPRARSVKVVHGVYDHGPEVGAGSQWSGLDASVPCEDTLQNVLGVRPAAREQPGQSEERWGELAVCLLHVPIHDFPVGKDFAVHTYPDGCGLPADPHICILALTWAVRVLSRPGTGGARDADSSWDVLGFMGQSPS